MCAIAIKPIPAKMKVETARSTALRRATLRVGVGFLVNIALAYMRLPAFSSPVVIAR
jgi:hypothetical protein